MIISIEILIFRRPVRGSAHLKGLLELSLLFWQYNCTIEVLCIFSPKRTLVFLFGRRGSRHEVSADFLTDSPCVESDLVR